MNARAQSDIVVAVLVLVDQANDALKAYAMLTSNRESLQDVVKDVPELLRRAHNLLEHNLKIATKNSPDDVALINKMKEAKVQLGIYERQYQTLFLNEMMALCQAINNRVDSVDVRLQALEANIDKQHHAVQAQLSEKLDALQAQIAELKVKPAEPAVAAAPAKERKAKTSLFGMRK